MTPKLEQLNEAVRRRWWVVFGLIAAFVAGWWLVLQFVPAHDTAWNFYFNLAYGVPYFAAAVAAFAAAWHWRRERYSETAPLVLLGISFILTGTAQAIWTWYNVAAGVEIPELSAADLFFVSGVLLESIALVAMLVHRLGRDKMSRARTAVLGVLAVTASFVAVRVLFRSLSMGTQTLLSLDSFYSITSFATIFLVIFNLNRDRHGEFRRFWYAMLVASVVSATGDTLFALRNNAGVYWNGDVSDGLYALAAICILFAALQLPARIGHAAEEIVEARRASMARVILPVAILLIGILVAGRIANGEFNDNTQALDRQTRIEATRVSEVFEGMLNQEVREAAALSALRLSGPLTNPSFQAFVRRLTEESPGPGQLFFVDANGRVAFSAGASVQKPGFDYLSDPDRADALERAVTTRRPSVSIPIRLADGRPGFAVLDPVYQGETYLGASGVSVPLPDLMSQIATVLPQDGLTTIKGDGRAVSEDGASVYDDAGAFLFGVPSSDPPRLAQDLPGAQNVDVPGFGKGWSVAVAPTALARQEVYSAALGFFIMIFLLMSATAIIAFLLVSQRAKLEEELRLKTYSLRQTITDLKQSKFFLDNVSDTVLVMDLHRRSLYQNKAAEEVFGAEAENAKKADWLYEALGVTPEAVDLTIERDGKWDGEAHVKKRGGHEKVVLVSIRPLFDDHGKMVANLALARDITDRKKVEQAKTQFVSMVAHQLRAPMTQLRWIVEQMLEEKVPKAFEKPLAQLQKIVLNENQFVGDLLNVSRIERGVLKLDKKPVPVMSLIDAIVKPLRPLAQERHVKIVVTKALDASVIVDEEKTVQAIRNVVDNAIKYSEEWTTVSIGASRSAGQALITITDQGSGIRPELRDKLFEIKTEISPDATPTSGSTGLGLYLTKKFIDAMDGSVDFRTGPHGTTFEIRLPLA